MTKKMIERHCDESPQKGPVMNYALWIVQGLLAFLFWIGIRTVPLSANAGSILTGGAKFRSEA